jgi:hypothetical protein
VSAYNFVSRKQVSFCKLELDVSETYKDSH